MTAGAPPVVRRAVPADAQALLDLSLAAIATSAAGHYTAAQLRAWSQRRTLAGHERVVEQTATLVAEVDGAPAGTAPTGTAPAGSAQAGRVVAGFASVALQGVGDLERGEVDQLFVHPDHGGRGVARRLLLAVDEAARGAGLDELVTHASWRAVPVFERAGYRQVRAASVAIGDQVLTRALMRKPLREEPSQT